jgi:hypothetical protein
MSCLNLSNDLQINLLIEQIIDEELMTEDAIHIGQVSNLALYINETASMFSMTLYDPKELIRDFKKLASTHKKMLELKDLEKAIYGTIQVLERNNFWMVGSVGANKGYGPLMYDLAMSKIYPEFLVPDRGSVKPGAQKVWTFINQNRKDEFRIIPIKKLTSDKQDLSIHKNSILNQAYAIKSSLDYTSLEKNHFDCIESLTAQGLIDSEYNTKDILTWLSDHFFYRKYEKAHW